MTPAEAVVVGWTLPALTVLGVVLLTVRGRRAEPLGAPPARDVHGCGYGTRMTMLALVAAVALALVHVAAARVDPGAARRKRFLSAAGGISVAYVFVHLLPEVGEAQEAIDEAATGALAAVERHAFAVALAGLVCFYGLELLGRRARRRHDGPAVRSRLFWWHVGAFAVHNAIIGYVLVERMTASVLTLVLFTIAIALHLLVNDYALEEHHRRAYSGAGRWLLAGAVLAGWAAGVVVDVPEAAFGVLVAFLAGGIVLSVLKEELPEYREGRFGAFAAGAAVTAGILLVV